MTDQEYIDALNALIQECIKRHDMFLMAILSKAMGGTVASTGLTPTGLNALDSKHEPLTR